MTPPRFSPLSLSHSPLFTQSAEPEPKVLVAAKLHAAATAAVATFGALFGMGNLP